MKTHLEQRTFQQFAFQSHAFKIISSTQKRFTFTYSLHIIYTFFQLMKRIILFSLTLVGWLSDFFFISIKKAKISLNAWTCVEHICTYISLKFIHLHYYTQNREILILEPCSWVHNANESTVDINFLVK